MGYLTDKALDDLPWAEAYLQHKPMVRGPAVTGRDRCALTGQHCNPNEAVTSSLQWADIVSGAAATRGAWPNESVRMLARQRLDSIYDTRQLARSRTRLSTLAILKSEIESFLDTNAVTAAIQRVLAASPAELLSGAARFLAFSLVIGAVMFGTTRVIAGMGRGGLTGPVDLQAPTPKVRGPALRPAASAAEQGTPRPAAAEPNATGETDAPEPQLAAEPPEKLAVARPLPPEPRHIRKARRAKRNRRLAKRKRARKNKRANKRRRRP